jgi:hypothetical protein
MTHLLDVSKARSGHITEIILGFGNGSFRTIAAIYG